MLYRIRRIQLSNNCRFSYILRAAGIEYAPPQLIVIGFRYAGYISGQLLWTEYTNKAACLLPNPVLAEVLGDCLIEQRILTPAGSSCHLLT